jgi:hypothetical protein
MVDRFVAVVVPLSVLGVSVVAFAPSSGAAQTGARAATRTGGSTTTAPGANPHSALCQRIHAANLTIRKDANQVQKADAENWATYKRALTAYNAGLSTLSLAVLQAGKNVPSNVRSAARGEVANIKIIQRFLTNAKRRPAGLSETISDSAKDFVTSQVSVIEYVGAQCGSVSGDSRPLTGVTAST